MDILHFGAGNIGRGLIAPVFLADKKVKKIIFLDHNHKLINKIQTTNSYEITEISNNQQNKVMINNYQGFTNLQDILANKELFQKITWITYSVGKENLPYLINDTAKIINKFNQLNNNQPLAIMCCENGVRVSSYFKKLIQRHTTGLDLTKVYFIDVVVDRIVPLQKSSSLDLKVEKYYNIICDKQQLINFDQQYKIATIKYSNNFDFEIDKKLWFLNGLHCALAWHRYSIDYFDNKKTLFEALQEKETLNFAKAYLAEITTIISAKYQIKTEDVTNYCQTLLYERLLNKFLSDELWRLGRNPQLKIIKNERILSPLLLAISKNLSCRTLIQTVKNSINYTYNNENNMKNYLASHSLQETIKEFTKINDSVIINYILRFW